MVTRLLLIGLAGCALVFAQRGGGGGSRGGGGNQGGGMMQPHTDKMDRISEALKLNKDQKKEVKSVLDDGQKEAAPLREQLEKQRDAVAEAVAGGKQEDIDAAVQKYSASAAQMASIEMNAFAKIYKLLEQDQQQRAGIIYQMMPGMFKGKNWNE